MSRRRLELKGHLSTEELGSHYRWCKGPKEARRWQALWLLSQSYSSDEVASIVGLGASWICKVIHRYNQEKRALDMKNRLMSIMDKLLLRKRAVIEAVSDQLKNISQIEHSRHRSIFNFMVNLVAALITYTHQPKKPSIGLVINIHVPGAI